MRRPIRSLMGALRRCGDMPPQVSYDDVPAPRGWLGIAFFGVFVYVASQLLKVYASEVARWTGSTSPEVLRILAVTSGLGSILVLAGLVAALWRSNLAAGLSGSGVRGLTLGAAGVGILLLFETALTLDFLGVTPDTVLALLRAQVIGDVLGNAFAFAGLASLAVGLANAARLFGESRDATPPSAAPGKPSA